MSANLAEVPAPLVTVAEVCQALRLGATTVYRWIEEGEIPREAVVRLGHGKRRGVRIRAWWLQSTLTTGQNPRARRIGGGRRA